MLDPDTVNIADDEPSLRYESEKSSCVSSLSSTAILGILCGSLLVVFLVVTIALAVSISNTNAEIDELSVDECVNTECLQQAAVITAAMNKSADPCNSFFNFACGGFAASNPISPDTIYISVRSKMKTTIEARLKLILEEPVKDSAFKTENKLKNFYTTCLNDYESMKTGADLLLGPDGLINATGGWNTLPPMEDPWNFNDILQRMNIDYDGRNFFTYFVFPDLADPKKNRIMIERSGTQFSSSAFYTSDTYKEAYTDLITAVMQLMIRDYGSPWTPEETETRINALVNTVFSVEQDIISIQAPNDENNPVSIKQLQDEASNIDWLGFFQYAFGNDIDENTNIYELNKGYASKVSDLLSSLNDTMRNDYMMWRMVNKWAQDLSYEYNHLYRVYQEIITGATEPKPLWYLCYKHVDYYLRDGLGALFIRDYFNTLVKENATALFKDVQDVVVKNTGLISWMTSSEREMALKKVTQILYKLGYMEWLADKTKVDNFYEQVDIGIDNHFNNLLNVHQWQKIRKQNEYKTEKEENAWIGHVYHVYGTYVKEWNEVEITGGIMQIPYFDVSFPLYLNYGGLGVLMSTELIRSIDSSGSKYAADGTYTDWWSEETRNTYNNRAECVGNMFKNVTIDIPGYGPTPVRIASRELEQVIATMEGVRTVWKMYEELIGLSGLTEMPGIKLNSGQLTFLAFAQTWCSNREPIDIYFSLIRGGLPDALLVDSVLMQVPKFSSHFNCPVGARMNPVEKCQVIF